MARPTKSGSLGVGVASKIDNVPPHLSLLVMLITEKMVFQDSIMIALPMAMKATRSVMPAGELSAVKRNRPTNTKKAICESDITNFIANHIGGFNHSNCALKENTALLKNILISFGIFMPEPAFLLV
jgi:hypothetical protein